jgi:2-polyprenyl-3-methyl-5-hydroxy-6-metoxy-1,4-benzoquinol methylase
VGRFLLEIGFYKLLKEEEIRKELEKCSMCESKQYETVFNGPVVSLVRCTSCQLMRLSPDTPYPESGELEHVAHAGEKKRYLRQRYQKESLQVRDYMKIEPVLVKLLPQKGSVLEVGCGSGEFLAFLKERAWEGMGIEANEEYVRYAAEKYGIKIIPSLFEEAELPNESFDVILMLHIIEHLANPRFALEKAARLLKPGGILVLETPRFDTIWFRILRHRERSILQDHLYYFTPKSISDMISTSGLVMKHIDLVGRTLTVDRLTYNIAKMINLKPLSWFMVKLSDGFHLDRMSIHLNFRDMMRVYSKKHTAS